MKLICLGLCWIAGICLGSWSGFLWVAITAIILVSLLAFKLRRNNALLLSLCIIALLGGILRIQLSLAAADEDTLRSYNDKSIVRIKGLVATAPESTGVALRFGLEAKEIEWETTWVETQGTVLVYAPLSSSYKYGDLLVVEGELRTPPTFDDFDWRAYLAHKGIYSVMNNPDSIELLSSGHVLKPLEWVYGMRSRLSQALDDALPEPQSSLAQAILLGQRSTIPGDLNQSLFRTGTTHIIAISGLNITIVAGLVLSLGVWLFGRKRPFYLWLAIVAVWGYAFLTGLQAPVLRAAIMGSIWLFADFIGRPRSALPALIFAAAVMIGIHPSVMREASFQLSFTAMAGLILLTPYFQSWGRKAFRVTDERRTPVIFLIDTVSVTLGATITTLPIVAFYFHQISLVSLPSNLLLLWVIPAIMGSAAVVGIVGLFAVSLSSVLGWIAWLFISYMISVVSFFSDLPFASKEVEVSAYFVWAYYAILCITLLLIANWSKVDNAIDNVKGYLSSISGFTSKIPARFVIFPLIIIAALTWTAAANVPDKRLHIFFFDVGQGDAVLIQTPAGQNILVDGGPIDSEIVSRLGERFSFRKQSIALAVITHPHEDHIGGLVNVLKKYEVRQVLEKPVEYDSQVYKEWQSLLDEKEIKRTLACSGQRIQLGEGLELQVLYAGGTNLGDTTSELDNNSIVLRLVCGNVSVLLTADIFEETEKYLIDTRFDFSSTVLKLAHHGSDSSSCQEFLSVVKPQVAIISVGADNPFGHPNPEVVNRLDATHLYRTDMQGTTELITDGKRLWVNTER